MVRNYSGWWCLGEMVRGGDGFVNEEEEEDNFKSRIST